MEQKWVVLKFGGTSVSNLDNWGVIRSVIEQRIAEEYTPVVVCSAISGISNLLEQVIKNAINGKYQQTLDKLQNKHLKLCREFKIDFEKTIGVDFTNLVDLLLGVSLLKEIGPRIQAQIMSVGELMLTKMAHRFLVNNGVDIVWQDARECMHAATNDFSAAHYLSAHCQFDPRDDVKKLLQPHKAIITQGFIARDNRGDTVLLGRGGSDTSATTFAALLQASSCEIWTDIPGIFTTDPRTTPEAFLLKELDYDEAQELASTGAKIIHPKCIAPAYKYNIPIKIKSVYHPLLEGTQITNFGHSNAPRVKGIAMKKDVKLISIETVNMWGQSGFLADLFLCFKNHKISIDLISTSESNITVSLDTLPNSLDKHLMELLLSDLKKFGDAKLIGPCASIGLVGKKIRTILHQLTPVFELFEEHKIHLISQAANDLNLTIVVDEQQAQRLLPKLHSQLFKEGASNISMLGPTYKECTQNLDADVASTYSTWWSNQKEVLKAMDVSDVPVYVYNQQTIKDSISELKQLKAVDKIFYAMKANFNPQVLETIYNQGIGFECVSTGEIKAILRLFPKISPQNIIFTPNYASYDEYKYALEQNVYVTIDNLHPLKHWKELFKNRSLFIRLDPGMGAGHHKFVKTAGMQSKFGVSPENIPSLLEMVDELKIKVVGLHAHIGSGIFSKTKWSETALFLHSFTSVFKDVKILDLGGGLGVSERIGHAAIDLVAIDDHLMQFKKIAPNIKIWIEPGRFVVANSGVMLTKVNQIKTKGQKRYIGVNAGMSCFIRPMLYGSYHEIVNLTRLEQGPSMVADIVGPICESGDTIGFARKLPETTEGDILLINATGAYGYAMSSGYNLRDKPREHFIKAN
ncbi:MAG: bifunctional aspartate kinase/diaminopimelate decarboxylase [Bacteriovoracaceae bacterium]|nr:bifunctional aspartate kinase/diaminopimelate decarboxylase [Bacteriovoracaceae bacterium]